MAKRQQMDRNFAEYALQGVEAAIEKLQRQAAELRRWLGKKTPKTAGGGGDNVPYPFGAGAELVNLPEARGRRRRRRRMSAAGRKRISEAQKARWAKQKAPAGAPKKAKSAKGGRTAKRRSA